MTATEEIVNVSEPSKLDAGGKLDAGVLELDAKDVVAGDEASVVVTGRLLDVAAYDKTSKESGCFSWKGGTYDCRRRFSAVVRSASM